MKHNSFIAIDFELFTPKITSACAIGLVKVIEGHISQKYYTLIKPIPDDSTSNN